MTTEEQPVTERLTEPGKRDQFAKDITAAEVRALESIEAMIRPVGSVHPRQGLSAYFRLEPIDGAPQRFEFVSLCNSGIKPQGEGPKWLAASCEEAKNALVTAFRNEILPLVSGMRRPVLVWRLPPEIRKFRQGWTAYCRLALADLTAGEIEVSWSEDLALVPLALERQSVAPDRKGAARAMALRRMVSRH